MLGVAHVLRRACMNRRTISDVEATGWRTCSPTGSSPAAWRGAAPPAPQRLSRRTIDKVAGFIEAGLTGRLSLEELAHVAALSPFHFARCFKATTGLAPHQ